MYVFNMNNDLDTTIDTLATQCDWCNKHIDAGNRTVILNNNCYYHPRCWLEFFDNYPFFYTKGA